VCFTCHKEGRTIQLCFKLFPHLKNKEGKGRQDRKPRHKSDGYKNKKKDKAMQAMWSAKSDHSETDGSGTDSGEDQEVNLALMTYVEDELSPINIDEIITSKNISDESTIQLLRNIVISKNKELESKQWASASTSSNGKNEVYLNLFCDSDESVDNDCDDVNDSSLSLRNDIIIDTNDRLDYLLDERNKALLAKEKIIEDLNAKIF
jgi:alkyl hydroperoxide reductase subunit AhpC